MLHRTMTYRSPDTLTAARGDPGTLRSHRFAALGKFVPGIAGGLKRSGKATIGCPLHCIGCAWKRIVFRIVRV